MPEIKMGVYRHYKGERYLVIGIAHDANEIVPGPREHDWSGPDARGNDVDGDRTCIHCGQDPRTWSGQWCEYVPRTVVVYVPLHVAKGPRMAVRALEDFLGWVHSDDRNGCRKPQWSTCTDSLHESGRHVQRRFTYVGDL